MSAIEVDDFGGADGVEFAPNDDNMGIVEKLEAEKLMLVEYCQDTQRQNELLQKERDEAIEKMKEAESRASQKEQEALEMGAIQV